MWVHVTTILDEILEWMLGNSDSLVVWMLVIMVVVILGYQAYSYVRWKWIPRRRQRITTAALMGILEASEREGIPLRDMLVRMSWLTETPLKAEFLELIERAAQGQPLGVLLQRHQTMLDHRMQGMIRLGDRLGHYSQVLAIYRRRLYRPSSQQSADINGSFNAPMLAVAAVLLFLTMVIIPNLRMIGVDLIDTPQSEILIGEVFLGWHVLMPSLLLVGIWVVILMSSSGMIQKLAYDPQSARWWRRICDWLAMRQPWHRKRVTRDFVEALALLLDARVPESEAIIWAAESTGSLRIQDRAIRAVRELQLGHSLPAALSRLDLTCELRWRMENAAASNLGFMDALDAWCDVLETEAWQSEQRVSQVITTLAVLVTGFVVAFVGVWIFGGLIELVEAGGLW